MRLKSPPIARRALPGQFVHVRCDETDYPLLRRPFSLLDTDQEKGTIDFIYKVVGLGTQVLAQISTGDRVDILGPLGRPFDTQKNLRTVYLVGGGVGIPPLYLLAKSLVKNNPWTSMAAFLGARTRDWVICVSQFRQLGIPVEVATDDGTFGFRGSVVELLQKFLESNRKDSHNDASGEEILYICGPTPMMAAAAKLARQKRFPAQVSLEERMGCAMGCCMGCVVEIATEPANSHKRFQRVCTEGPVFPAEAVVWSGQ